MCIYCIYVENWRGGYIDGKLLYIHTYVLQYRVSAILSYFTWACEEIVGGFSFVVIYILKNNSHVFFFFFFF